MIYLKKNKKEFRDYVLKCIQIYSKNRMQQESAIQTNYLKIQSLNPIEGMKLGVDG